MKYPVASLVFDEILLTLFAKGCFTFFAEKPDWDMLTVLRMLCVFEMRNDSSVFFIDSVFPEKNGSLVSHPKHNEFGAN